MLQQKGYNHNSLSDSSEQYLHGHNVSTIVLVSYGYCNNLPEISWFNTRQIYSSTVLEARNPKSVLLVPARPAPSRSSMGESASAPFWLLEAACTLGLHEDPFLTSLQPLASGVTPPTSPLDLLISPFSLLGPL